MVRYVTDVEVFRYATEQHGMLIGTHVTGARQLVQRLARESADFPAARLVGVWSDGTERGNEELRLARLRRTGPAREHAA